MQGWDMWGALPCAPARHCPAPTSWENRKNKVTPAAQGSTQLAFLSTKPCKACWKSPLHPMPQLASLRDCPSQGLQGPPQPLGLSQALWLHMVCRVTSNPGPRSPMKPVGSQSPSAPWSHTAGTARSPVPHTVPGLGPIPSLPGVASLQEQWGAGLHHNRDWAQGRWAPGQGLAGLQGLG